MLKRKKKKLVKKPARKTAKKKAVSLVKKRKKRVKEEAPEVIFDSTLGNTDALFVSLPDQSGSTPEIEEALKEFDDLEKKVEKNPEQSKENPIEEKKENKKGFWRKIFSLNNRLFSILIGLIFAGVFCTGVYVFATSYKSYGLLDPNCAPGSEGCTVAPPVGTSQSGTVKELILDNSGNQQTCVGNASPDCTNTSGTLNNGYQGILLPLDSSLRSMGLDKNKRGTANEFDQVNLNIARVTRNIDGFTYSNPNDPMYPSSTMLLGDTRMDWVSIPTTLDMVGRDIIDVSRIGNKNGDYDTRLVQAYGDSTSRILALSTSKGPPDGGTNWDVTTYPNILDRLVIGNGHDVVRSVFQNTEVVFSSMGGSDSGTGNVGGVGGTVYFKDIGISEVLSPAPARVNIQPRSATDQALHITPATSQTADLIYVDNATADGPVLQITSLGKILNLKGMLVTNASSVDVIDGLELSTNGGTSNNYIRWDQSGVSNWRMGMIGSTDWELKLDPNNGGTYQSALYVNYNGTNSRLGINTGGSIGAALDVKGNDGYGVKITNLSDNVTPGNRFGVFSAPSGAGLNKKVVGFWSDISTGNSWGGTQYLAGDIAPPAGWWGFYEGDPAWDNYFKGSVQVGLTNGIQDAAFKLLVGTTGQFTVDASGNVNTSGTGTFSGGVITKYATSDPLLTTNGSIAVSYEGAAARIRFVANGTEYYIDKTGGFGIPSNETSDPISGEKMKIGDLVLGMVNQNLGDENTPENSSLHGIWVKWDTVKAELIKEIVAAGGNLSSLSADGTSGTGSISGVDTSTTMLERVTNVLTSIGISVKNGVTSIASLTTQKFSTDTATIKGLQMVDKATGEIYCTWIENGEWQKVRGECGSQEVSITTATSAPQAQIQTEQITATANQVAQVAQTVVEAAQQAQTAADQAQNAAETAQQAVQQVQTTPEPDPTPAPEPAQPTEQIQVPEETQPQPPANITDAVVEIIRSLNFDLIGSIIDGMKTVFQNSSEKAVMLKNGLPSERAKILTGSILDSIRNFIK